MNKVLKQFNVAMQLFDGIFPAPLGAICEALGIEVMFENLEDDYSGKIEKYKGKYIITVNDNHPAERNMFTIAHEIGHFVKHKHILDERGFCDRKREGYDEDEMLLEREANTFAAELLMPKEKFIEMYELSGGDFLFLQDYFRASKEAVFFRALNLGLILA